MSLVTVNRFWIMDVMKLLIRKNICGFSTTIFDLPLQCMNKNFL